MARLDQANNFYCDIADYQPGLDGWGRGHGIIGLHRRFSAHIDGRFDILFPHIVPNFCGPLFGIPFHHFFWMTGSKFIFHALQPVKRVVDFR